jgi:SAM-dependent methyltransferase
MPARPSHARRRTGRRDDDSTETWSGCHHGPMPPTLLDADLARVALVAEQWRRHEETLRLPDRVRAALADDQITALLRSGPNASGFHEWSGHTDTTLALYAMPANRARLAWLLTAVSAQERIVDIGCGSGSIGGRILALKHPDRYAAIEPSERMANAFVGTMEANGITPDRYELHHGSAEDLVLDVVTDVQPTLVLLLEVLEHVRDAGAVLGHVGRSLPTDSDLLISVPVLGRIEAEWGHLSVFDRSRLETLIADAGLRVHWVQPIADQWLFLLLSPTERAPSRLVHLCPPPAGRASSAPEQYMFRQVPIADPATLEPPRGRAVSTRIECGAASVVRMRVLSPERRSPPAATAELLSGERVLERWVLTRTELARATPGPATWIFRRGEAHGRRHRLLAAGEPDALRLTVEARWRRPALTIQRIEAVTSAGEPPVPIQTDDYIGARSAVDALRRSVLSRGRRWMERSRRWVRTARARSARRQPSA